MPYNQQAPTEISGFDAEVIMSTTCTRCENTGFLNLYQIPDSEMADLEKSDNFEQAVLKWMEDGEHDVQVCDCCGDGEEWYGVPGEHYNSEDPQGHDGPYAYNGGLCECH